MARFEYQRLSILPHHLDVGWGWADHGIAHLYEFGHYVAWMFQAQEPDIITHVGCHVSWVRDTPGAFRISLRNIGPSGLPGTNVITSQTFTPEDTAEWTDMFHWFELVAPLQVVRGQFLALMVDHPSTTMNGRMAVWCGVGAESGGTGRQFPYTYRVDELSSVRDGEMPIMAYKSAFRAYGLPLQSIKQEQFNNPMQRGLRFWMNPGWGKTFRIKGAQIFCYIGEPGRNVDMILYDSSNTELERLSIDTDIIENPVGAGYGAMYPALFPGSMSTLEFGNQYILAFEPQEVDTDFWVCCLEAPTSFDMTALPGGAAFYMVERANDTEEWTTVKNQRPIVELIIEDWTKE